MPLKSGGFGSDFVEGRSRSTYPTDYRKLVCKETGRKNTVEIAKIA